MRMCRKAPANRSSKAVLLRERHPKNVSEGLEERELPDLSAMSFIDQEFRERQMTLREFVLSGMNPLQYRGLVSFLAGPPD